MSHRAARLAFRLLLRVYPRAFRDRFAHDLEVDFAEILATQGSARAWRRVLADVPRSLPSIHRHERATRSRQLEISGEAPMGSFLFDLRHAVRGLLKAPVFTAVIVATLALGIGASSAIFSLVSAVLLRPVGYRDPDRVMLVYEGLPEANLPRFGVSPADYQDFVNYQRSFTDVGAYRTRLLELSGMGESQQVTVGQVMPSVWTVLGVNAGIGRTFVDQDASSVEPVAVDRQADQMGTRRFHRALAKRRRHRRRRRGRRAWQ